MSRRYTKYTKELLEPLVQECTSVAQVMRKLGLREAGGNHTHLSRKIKNYGIDTSHFLGQACNQGEDHKGGPDKKSWKEVLIKRDNGTREKTFRLRRALFELGREYVCEVCGQEPIWNGKELRLQVDHINGDWLDNRPKNVRFICPHCHTQTSGYCGSQGLSELTSTSKYNRYYAQTKKVE